jgi:coenzyme F420-dependent glucose-6-phosphate dehydrogenase
VTPTLRYHPGVVAQMMGTLEQEDTRVWAGLSLTHEQKVGVYDPREMDRRSAELPIEQVARRWIVSDDPDEHVARIASYIELGFTHLVFRSPTQDQRRFLNLCAEHVIPRLRQWSPNCA